MPTDRHVFISYSRKDTEFVEKLERDLRAQGITTWRDTSSIVGGEEWYKAIVRGIHAAYVMVQVCTLASDQSKWVRREALYADQQDLPVIPVMPALHDVPFHLIDTQPVRFDDPTYESGLARLLAALEHVRGSRPTADAAPIPAPDLGPTARATEIAYLDFLLGELKADLRTARYVNLGATREKTAPHHTAADELDEFALSFDRFEPLVKAERIRGENLDQPDAPEPDARVPLSRKRPLRCGRI